jgi:hypothetical protein
MAVWGDRLIPVPAVLAGSLGNLYQPARTWCLESRVKAREAFLAEQRRLPLVSEVVATERRLPNRR